jgi:hypothetical protein
MEGTEIEKTIYFSSGRNGQRWARKSAEVKPKCFCSLDKSVTNGQCENIIINLGSFEIQETPPKFPSRLTISSQLIPGSSNNENPKNGLNLNYPPTWPNMSNIGRCFLAERDPDKGTDADFKYHCKHRRKQWIQERTNLHIQIKQVEQDKYGEENQKLVTFTYLRK